MRQLTRADLDQRLSDLEALLPSLRAEYSEPGDFADAYAGIAEPIADLSGADEGVVRERLVSMFERYGVLT